ILQWNPPVLAFGPGSARALPPPPPDTPRGHQIPTVNPTNPTPGLADITRSHLEAHAYDVNIRIREAGRADLSTLVVPHEIALPVHVGAGPERVAPPMEPVVVVEDERVSVSAVLVQHAPVFPSFAYRFDTDDGSVVISGDTAPSPNLVALARGADILVHEVFADDLWDQWDEDEEEDWEASQREHHLFTAHTGLSDVGEVAGEAEVGRLVLTHFIPGDDTLPDEHWTRGTADSFAGEVVVGSDLLELSL
ncbi:MAG: MBL fold metallo-hydrolase, partial [Actinomycetota bacterium]|nr:MBL fold metallo-hydrolase [Actinomycetota bacterium]